MDPTDNLTGRQRIQAVEHLSKAFTELFHAQEILGWNPELEPSLLAVQRVLGRHLELL